MDDRQCFLKGKILSGRVYPEFFPLNPNDRVVNLGCGEGPQAIVYAGQYKEMVGVDINKDRLIRSEEAMKVYGIQGYATLWVNVENIPLPDKSFDKAIAIDIIEHVQSPKNLGLEVNRLLKENGELLITFSAMHDKFTKLFTALVCLIPRRKRKEPASSEWNPDAHNQEYPLSQWIRVIESCGFKLYKARATTLFPPLHLYGIPRFWFKSNIIHKIDSFFCKIPVLRNYGQSLLCIFIKLKITG
jgi:ubiquinone/menaquinone biosynthesis C-methylase UbiE